MRKLLRHGRNSKPSSGGGGGDPIQSIFDAFIEGGLTDVGEFIYGDPPGIDPYFFLDPLDFNNFYKVLDGGYQTLNCEIHLTSGYISDEDLEANLKVGGVYVWGEVEDGVSRVSNPNVTVRTDNSIQYIYFSVDIDMSSVPSYSVNHYGLSLEYNGREVIDFNGTLGFSQEGIIHLTSLLPVGLSLPELEVPYNGEANLLLTGNPSNSTDKESDIDVTFSNNNVYASIPLSGSGNSFNITFYRRATGGCEVYFKRKSDNYQLLSLSLY